MVVMASGPAGNLPAELTSFVGRRREVAEVRRLLSMSRLVTLTGVGGVGKTRLALRAAAEFRRAFEAIWLVDLAGLTDPSLVAQTVAATVGLRDRSAHAPLSVLSDFLAPQRVLLVLDNCEHLLDACAVLADALLRAAPELRILATSRQSLRIDGEFTLAVTPLSTPEWDGPPRSLKALEQYEAVNLFADRAAAVLPGFALNDSNGMAVVRLCQQLDGIPLAIELAAVRLRAFSVTEIEERLADRYRLLTGGSRVAVPRQQTLRALVDWSYGLLSGPERELWARLSVFAGNFGLAAAEGVCAGGDIAADEVPDLLADLVDKSLVLREEHLGMGRYRLLGTLRQFGQEKLDDSGERELLLRRHRDWYQGLAEQAAREWFGPQQVSWFNRLRLERADVWAALEYGLSEPGEAEAGLRIASVLLQPFWLANSLVSEGRGWLGRLLEKAPAAGTARVKGLWACAWLALLQGDPATVPLLAESGRLADQLDDLETSAYVLGLSGMATLFRDDEPAATRLLREAVDHMTRIDDPFGITTSSLALALSLGERGESDQAVALCEECLALTGSRDETWNQSYALRVLAVERWHRGENLAAASLAREALLASRSFDDRFAMAVDVEVLAWVAAVNGDPRRAALLFGAAEAIASSVGVSPLQVKRFLGYHDRCQAQVQGALGDRAFGRAFEDGAGLTVEQAAAEALTDGTGVPERASPGQAASTSSPLTPRETEIAELVAHGLSNKAIAASLVISQRTAEGHVEHILSKLGFTSRAQIAAWVAAYKSARPR